MKAQNNKILGLDLGTRRIGVAITDESRTVVFPRDTIEEKKFSSALKKIRDICVQENIGLIVVGLPLDEEDRERKITAWIRQKTEEIKKETGLPVAFVDEAFSTEEGIAKAGKNRVKTRDMMAAMVILERYLVQQVKV